MIKQKKQKLTITITKMISITRISLDDCDVVVWERFYGRIIHAAHERPLAFHMRTCVVHKLCNPTCGPLLLLLLLFLTLGKNNPKAV